MHDYSIRNSSKRHVYYWVSAIAIIISPIIIKLAEHIIQKHSYLSEIYEKAGFLGFSLSALVVFSLLWFLFTKYIWKILSKLKIMSVPNISGEWDCSGKGNKYACPDKQNKWKGIIQIEQEYEKISIKLTTEQSKSHSYSLVGDIEIHGQNEIILSYMYENEPYENEEGLNQHKGFCRLIFDLKNKIAKGRYYTDKDRGSYGVMELKKRDDK